RRPHPIAEPLATGVASAPHRGVPPNARLAVVTAPAAARRVARRMPHSCAGAWTPLVRSVAHQAGAESSAVTHDLRTPTRARAAVAGDPAADRLCPQRAQCGRLGSRRGRATAA